jgi:hypothetical protein
MATGSSFDWTTVSELATGVGTLVLAAATFASVRSSNRTARLTERSLQAGLRPLLLPSRLQDLDQKVGFQDTHYVKVGGGLGVAEVVDDVVYLVMSLRNVGTGIAVLDAWHLIPDRVTGSQDLPSLEDFRRLTRDLYVPAGDIGFWQGTFRDPSEPDFQEACEAISAGKPVTLDVLYGDHEGGQRVVSRFLLQPRKDGGHLVTSSRHWNIDRADPR